MVLPLRYDSLTHRFPVNPADSHLAGHLLDLLSAQSRALAVILLDNEGKIVGWLAGAGEIFGYEESEVLGRRLDFLLPLYDRERGGWRCELQDAQTCGEHTDTRWLLRKDRTLVCMDSVLTPLRDENGQLAGYGKVLHYSAAHRASDEHLRIQSEALLRRNAERNEFIGTLAHELRNVIGPLCSAAQLLRLKADGGKPDRTAEVISRQVGFIVRLVDELMEMTRLDHGQVELAVAETDLATALAQALESCDGQLTARGQSVLVAIAQPIALQADPIRLQQVLVNLISNASKYSARDCRIWIKGEADDGHAVIRVLDHGCGIAPEFLPHVFEPFKRGGPCCDGDSKADGLGLGLAIVKSIVELHAGTIDVKSDGAGKGCECVVRLPLRRI